MKPGDPVEELAARRAELQARAALQRQALARQADDLRAAWSPVNLALRAVQAVREHPATVLGGLVAPWLVRRRGLGRVLRWGGVALAAWQVWQGMKAASPEGDTTASTEPRRDRPDAGR